MNNNKIVLIVEGLKYEPNFFNILINQLGFFNDKIEVIILPTTTNIYSLYKKMTFDEDLDIIEIAKEMLANEKSKKATVILDQFESICRKDVSEIYLFYDFDGHSNNLPKEINRDDYLQELVKFFDNETGHGKIYLSYPMVEALQWFSDEICYDDCLLSLESFKNFKAIINQYKLNNHPTKLTIDDIKLIIYHYFNRIGCLFNITEIETISSITKNVDTFKILHKQYEKCINTSNSIMILSAFSQFLIEYFKEDYLRQFFGEEFLPYKMSKCHRFSNKFDK